MNYHPFDENCCPSRISKDKQTATELDPQYERVIYILGLSGLRSVELGIGNESPVSGCQLGFGPMEMVDKVKFSLLGFFMVFFNRYYHKHARHEDILLALPFQKLKTQVALNKFY